jgi:hypothetical protein
MKNHATIIASILAAALCAVSPIIASASDHESSSGNSSGSSSSDTRSAPAPAPAQRSDPAPAPAVRSDSGPAPVDRVAPTPVERSVTSPVTNAPSEQAATQPLPPPRRVPVLPTPRYQPPKPMNNKANANNQSASNSNDDSNQWDWDYGAAWIGTQSYYGDGFWGPLKLGLAANAYIVGAGSPGAQLLQEYGLTQTPCGPPNLVEIEGPGGSKLCALPNDHVAAGVYYVDMQTLTLISSS